MFRSFMKEFESTPIFNIGDVVLVRFDIANENGVLLRGTPVIISEVILGSYKDGICYTVEDNYGNFASDVNEFMLRSADERVIFQGVFNVVDNLKRFLEDSKRQRITPLQLQTLDSSKWKNKSNKLSTVIVDEYAYENMPKPIKSTKPIPPPKIKKFKIQKKARIGTKLGGVADKVRRKFRR